MHWQRSNPFFLHPKQNNYFEQFAIAGLCPKSHNNASFCSIWQLRQEYFWPFEHFLCPFKHTSNVLYPVMAWPSKLSLLNLFLIYTNYLKFTFFDMLHQGWVCETKQFGWHISRVLSLLHLSLYIRMKSLSVIFMCARTNLVGFTLYKRMNLIGLSQTNLL